MAIVCSNCDVTPVPGAAAGAACAACGERLVEVASEADVVGTTIDGRFEILAVLGRGGMGVVYRAKQLSIGREIAVKMIPTRDVDAVKRFFREAKLASALQHPNTVPIIDFGQTADGRLYLAMELVRGKTLLDEINDRGAMPVSRVATIGVQLCDALEAAHELQIVHRDLKLDNAILVHGKRDHIKVLDFGLARSLVDPSTALTAANLISGTPRYMAPEVGIDAAAPAPTQDMYSVGVMLAEMALGRPLWKTTTIEALFASKLATEDSIAEVPAALKPLIRSLLASEPAKRPTAGQTRQLLRDLEAPHTKLELELDGDSPPLRQHPRAVSPIALEPTGLAVRVEVEAASPDPFASLDNVGLVSLDEREGPIPKPSPVTANPAPLPEPAAPLGALDERFTAPEIQAPPKLEIDRAYIAERGRKLAARQAPVMVVKQSSGIGKWIAVLLVLGILGAGGYAFYKYVYLKDRDAKMIYITPSK